MQADTIRYESDLVDDAGGINENRLWDAVVRLEASSQAARDEQIAANASLDAVRDEQTVMNVRVNAIEKEQVSVVARLDAIEKEQVTTNARLAALERGQVETNRRMDALDDRLSARMDKLFYAIIGGSFAITAAVIIHGIL